jgi:hypothetical protein
MREEILSASNFIIALLSNGAETTIKTEKLTKLKWNLMNSFYTRFITTWDPRRPQEGADSRRIHITDKMDQHILKAATSCGINAITIRKAFPKTFVM